VRADTDPCLVVPTDGYTTPAFLAEALTKVFRRARVVASSASDHTERAQPIGFVRDSHGGAIASLEHATTLFEVVDGLGHIPKKPCRHAQGVERNGKRQFVTELSPDREALEVACARLVVVALTGREEPDAVLGEG